jgi:cytochrome c-type biogenesis protein CcmH
MLRAAKTLRWLLLALACFASAPALAVQPDEILADPALESRARELSRELRCMVCQNQSIDDSDAPLARDLRLLVRERLKAGDSDGQVLDFLTARYGQFVLLKPRFGWDTALLWLAPAVVLLLGGVGLVSLLRRRRRAQAAPEQPLTEAEKARLAELLREGGPSTPPSTLSSS